MLVVGLAIFLLSVLQPFLNLYDVTPFSGELRVVPFYQVDFSTFKVTYDPGIFGRVEFWNSFWFNNELWGRLEIFSPIALYLIVAFAIQVLTLATGFFTLSLKPRTRIIPLALSLSAMFILTWVFLQQPSYPWIRLRYAWNLADGYWLTLVSVLCISSSIILARGRQSRIMFEE